MSTPVIYLDYNATTPVDPRVLDTMMPYFSGQFGNASSTQHAYGWDAEEAVATARAQVAQLIGARTHEIIFTSGATESINLALFGLVSAYPQKKHIITCETEHRAVLDCCKALEKKGITITYLPVDKTGSIDLAALSDALSSETLAVCIMHAHNETGVIQPIEKMRDIAHEQGALFMTDATQSVGKIPFEAQWADIAVLSAHKIYGPKGVGALYLNKASDFRIAPQVFGGGHEWGYRSGTLNVPGIVGLGKACHLCGKEMEEEALRLGHLREKLEAKIIDFGAVKINGSGQRLPQMTNVSFQDIKGEHLMRTLRGVAVSQGSACSASQMRPSHVLKAMGLTDALALSSMRIGLGRFTTEEEIDRAGLLIAEAVEKLKCHPS